MPDQGLIVLDANRSRIAAGGPCLARTCGFPPSNEDRDLHACLHRCAMTPRPPRDRLLRGAPDALERSVATSALES
jgi:hypothetical protein